MIGFNLNIFVSTGSKTTEYKKILEKEIKTQSLECNIIEDISIVLKMPKWIFIRAIFGK